MTKCASARRITGTVVPGVLATVVLLACADRERPARPEDDEAQMEAVPPSILDPPWLDSARQAQLASAGKLRVFHDFTFSDRARESNIRFRHKIVADAGKHFKPVHYDHGNGIAVADVDGDGLYDIYFLTQVGSNQLWRNLGHGKFEDITEDAGVAVADPISVTASFADIDSDGDPDLYVTTVRDGNVLFENDGSGRFTDISKRSGLDYRGHSSGAVFFDYNRDGLLDLFLTNVGMYTHDSLTTVTSDIAGEPEYGEYSYHVGFEDAFQGHLKPERAERSVLFKNMGDNRFSDVSEEVGLVDVSWSGDASPLDANDDGWPDLYVLNMQGNNHYYENVGGERFVDKSRGVFPQTPPGAMGIKVFDYNNDGRMDIYITDMHSDMVGVQIQRGEEKLKSRMSDSVSIFGNAFYENEGGGRYREISDQIGAENYWPWGLSVGDLNADGYEDVFIASSMNFPLEYGVNSVLLNNEGEEFFDSEFILGVEPRRGGRTAKPWFAVDCSGKDREHRDCRERSGRWVVWGALGSRSSAIFDLDNDGDLDIVTNDFNSEPMLLISDLSERKERFHFLKIVLIGTTSNRSGLGATVKVDAGFDTYTKVHDGKSGYLSQSLYPLYFGLGDSETVDRIEVHWPSGQQQVVSGPINVDTLIEVTER